ncbi:protein dachsous-like [Branchiostoma floridae x Branchiostoma japonicum]
MATLQTSNVTNVTYVLMCCTYDVFTLLTDGRVLVTSQLDFNIQYSIPVAELDSFGAILTAYVIHVNLTSDVSLYKDPDGLCNTTSFYVTMEESSDIVFADLASLTNQSFSRVQFSLVPGGDADRFSIDPSSGVITPNSPLDREERDTLVFRIAMATRYDVTFGTVTVAVTDINDNPPTIVETRSSEYILQSTPINSIVGLVRGEDPDAGENATLTYTIVTEADEDFSELFFINNVTGVITVISNFKVIREHIPLKIKVLDNGEPPRAAETTVELSLLSNDAVGNLTRLELTVPEDVPIGTALVNATVPASAGDGTIVYTYAMQDPSGINEKYFHVHNETGEITVISELDRETEPSHQFFVEPNAESGCDRQPLILVDITLEDINDNDPVFKHGILQGTVPENTPIGEPVIVIPELAVTDRDFGIHGSVDIRITGLGASNFAVNSTAGQIYTTGTLDYETAQSYSLTIEARDMDGTFGYRSATARLTIELQDENDNSPQFSQEDFHFSIHENAMGSAFVGTVLATDRDSAHNGKVDHFIVDGGDGVFQLDFSSGQLTLVRGDLLDREAVDWYMLTIRAQDRGSPSLSTFTNVNVTVTDVNDNAPSFDDDTLRHAVTREPIRTEENLPNGTHLLTLYVTDPDAGVSGAVHLDVNTDGFFAVMLDNSTQHWALVSTGVLDREERETYELGITATDMGTPALSTSINIVLAVDDVNDVAPTFLEPPDEVTLLRRSHPGTLVAIFAVEDPDENGAIEYSIAQNRPKLFDIDDRGVVSVKRSLPDPHVTDTMHMNVTIEVTDGLHLTNTTLRVHVEDGSSLSSLEFQRENYHFDVVENSTTGTVIGSVNVSSDDPVQYSLQSPQQDFTIDSSTGTIRTQRPLDREEDANHDFIVVATESAVWFGFPRKAYAVVSVRVLDVNDNAPEFGREAYTAHVSENAPDGDVILTPSASDPDDGENADIVYSKAEGDGTFTVDPETGAVRVNATLDREAADRHLVVVQATDGGNLSSTVTVIIHVGDVNDNTPDFTQDHYNISVPENNDDKRVLSTVATDDDIGLNGRVRYSLVGADNFTIGELTGEISATFTFDRESVSSYNFTVLAVDGGDPPRSSAAEVSITVTDVNDNSPAFLRTPYRQKVAEDTPTGTSVFTVTATDADSGENGAVTYRTRPDGICGDLFLVDSTTGVLRTRQSLQSINQTEREYCVAIVTAHDHGPEQKRTSVKVVFNITDANRHDPVFESTRLSRTVDESWNVWREELFTVKATDEDRGVNGEVSYRILDDYGIFTVVRLNESGQVWANRSLDREERDFYNLTLEASDGAVINPRTATAALDIWIDDMNDNPPRFVRDNVTAEEIILSQNTSVGTHVIQVTSTDEDVGTNAIPLYRIDSVQDMHISSPTHLFTIDGYTGDVNTSSAFPNLTEDYYVNVTLSVEDAMNPDLRLDFLTLRIVVPFISTNRKSPWFPQVLYTVNLTREDLIGGLGRTIDLVTVSAEDDDAGPDGQIEYSILNPDDTWFDLLGVLWIKEGTVVLVVNPNGTVLTGHAAYRQRMVIQAQDGGQPVRTGTTEVLLYVLPVETSAASPVVFPVPSECSYRELIAAVCVAGLAIILTVTTCILYIRNRLELKKMKNVKPAHHYELVPAAVRVGPPPVRIPPAPRPPASMPPVEQIELQDIQLEDPAPAPAVEPRSTRGRRRPTITMQENCLARPG